MKMDTDTNAVNDAVEWAHSHGMSMKKSPSTAVHTAFSFTPTPISKARFVALKKAVGLLGKLVHHISEDHAFLHKAISPITSGDLFFAALLSMHQTIHPSFQPAPRLPLLIMRSDFMDDSKLGPKLVEFNGIAAGMGPFGQRIHELHKYLRTQWPKTFSLGVADSHEELVENSAIKHLADGINNATLKIKQEFADAGPPRFLMIVQEHEDNVFDQHLLEYALQEIGVQTLRRTFRELHGKLSTGTNQRLMLEGVGSIDSIYLRAGYQYADYYASDLDGKVCCESLIETRTLIESHRVAINATVSQQLATSKRVQMLISSMDAQALTEFGLNFEEATQVKELLVEMLAVDDSSSGWLSKQPESDWVLKNQGEGGGHCIFGIDIRPQLDKLEAKDYQAWSLMRRLHPTPRTSSALLVRNGKTEIVDDLISEIGMFTIHIDGNPAITNEGYAGYLVRSKPAQATEGGVHSGLGVLDSLILTR